MARWQDSYRVGQTVEVLVQFQFGPQCVTGKVLRKTKTGFPVVQTNSCAFAQVCDRKSEVRLPGQFVTITAADVGKSFFRAFGKTWMVQDWIGRILEQDVGKRVFMRGDRLQVENDEQLTARGGRS